MKQLQPGDGIKLEAIKYLVVNVEISKNDFDHYQNIGEFIGNSYNYTMDDKCIRDAIAKARETIKDSDYTFENWACCLYGHEDLEWHEPRISWNYASNYKTAKENNWRRYYFTCKFEITDW